MRAVRRAGTQPEALVAVALSTVGIRFRRNVKTLPGSPDFANRSMRLAIFVHGCYWHSHRGCARATVPKRNRRFWIAKFAANQARDVRKVRALRKLGFRVLTIWECETRRLGLEKKLIRFVEGK